MTLNPWTIRERLFESEEERERLFQDIADDLGIDMGNNDGPSEQEIREAEAKRLREMEAAVYEAERKRQEESGR